MINDPGDFGVGRTLNAQLFDLPVILAAVEYAVVAFWALWAPVQMLSWIRSGATRLLKRPISHSRLG